MDWYVSLNVDISKGAQDFEVVVLTSLALCEFLASRKVDITLFEVQRSPHTLTLSQSFFETLLGCYLQYFKGVSWHCPVLK